MLLGFFLSILRPLIIGAVVIGAILFGASRLNVDWNKLLGGGTKEVSLTYVLGHTVKKDLTVYATRPALVEVEGVDTFIFGIQSSDRTIRIPGECSAGIDFREYPESLETTSDPNELVVKVSEPYFLGCAITDVPQFKSGPGIIRATTELYNQLLQKGFDAMKSQALAVSSDLLPEARASTQEALIGHYIRVLLAQGVKNPKVTVLFRKP